MSSTVAPPSSAAARSASLTTGSRKDMTTFSSLPVVNKLRLVMPLGIWLGLYLWNLSSPIKNWVLGRYEISNSDVFVSKGLDWTDQLDYGYVKYLYDHAGIRCDYEPGRPVRLVNVYVDFLLLQKAKHWASGINTWHQDTLIGRYCQSGLREKRQLQHNELLRFVDKPYEMWGRLVQHVFPDQTNCRVNEIPEAILCLKGYNASQLINLEWSTGLDVTLPENHDALAAWQAKLLPDLNNCLNRRQYWMQENRGDRGAALDALANEMASNFSLDLHGFAGKNNLMAVYVQEEGFVDISGKQAGRRTVAISGIITERTRYNMDGDVNAVTAIRELMWLCVFSRPNKDSFRQCLENEALVISAFFLGNQYNMTVDQLATRYIDDNVLLPGGMMGNKTVWNYRTVFPPPVIKYLLNGSSDGVESAYSHQVDVAIVAELLNQPAPNDSASGFLLSWKCVYEQGCFDLCYNMTERTADFYMFYAIKRSGYCYRHRISTELINRNGFVSRECYGIGKGNYTILFKLNRDPQAVAITGLREPIPEYLEVHNLVDPMMTLACIMGGRIPAANDNPFPTEFHDMVALGTGMTMSIIFSDGTEQVLLNTYALFSLVGTIFYAFFIVKEGYYILQLVRRGLAEMGLRGRLQLLVSVSLMSISNRVWHRYYPFLLVFGFFTVFSWTIGASKAMCMWYVNGVAVRQIPADALDTSVTPEYKCHAGAVGGPLSSAWEFIRFLSAASVASYIIMGRSTLLGVHRSVSAWGVKEVLAGGVPTIIMYFIVTLLNHLRMQVDHLAAIHTQIYFGVLWMVLMLAFYLSMPVYSKFVFKVLTLFGLYEQPVDMATGAYEFTKSFVAFHWEQHGSEDATWIPLSVLLEIIPGRKLKTLNFKARRFEKGKRTRPGSNAVHPSLQKSSTRKLEPVVSHWTLEVDEFFVCMSSKAESSSTKSKPTPKSAADTSSPMQAMILEAKGAPLK